MTVALITHPAAGKHVTPSGHPECAARIDAVLEALSAPEFDALARSEAQLVAEAELLRAHSRGYLNMLEEQLPASGTVQLDPDTWMTPGSLEAARRGAGGACQAVDLVLSGAHRAAFVAMRPPGHHAERPRPMGFCLYSNAAVAALHALAQGHCERVAVLDFDVHHGNGTQDILEREPRAFFASSHEFPLWPGTGAAHETGCGNVVNAPLPNHSGSAEFRAAWEEKILPAAAAHRPDLVIVSAGFDAHRRDPLATLQVETEDYVWVTRRIVALAEEHAMGRVVSMLEGGYDLPTLAEAVGAHVRTLMETPG